MSRWLADIPDTDVLLLTYCDLAVMQRKRIALLATNDLGFERFPAHNDKSAVTSRRGAALPLIAPLLSRLSLNWYNGRGKTLPELLIRRLRRE